MDKIKQLRNKIVRPTGKLTDILPLAALLSVVLIYAGAFISMIILNVPAVKGIFEALSYNESMATFMNS